MLNKIVKKIVKGVVYALARVVAFYGNEGVMPAYTAVKSLSESFLKNKFPLT